MFQYTSWQLLTNQTAYLIKVHTSPKFWICLHGIGIGTEALGRGGAELPQFFLFELTIRDIASERGRSQPHSKHNCSLIYLVGKSVLSFRYTCPPPLPHPPPRISIWIDMILGISIFWLLMISIALLPFSFNLLQPLSHALRFPIRFLRHYTYIYDVISMRIYIIQFSARKKFLWSFSVAFDKDLILIFFF